MYNIHSIDLLIILFLFTRSLRIGNQKLRSTTLNTIDVSRSQKKNINAINVSTIITVANRFRIDEVYETALNYVARWFTLVI